MSKIRTDRIQYQIINLYMDWANPIIWLHSTLGGTRIRNQVYKYFRIQHGL